MFNYSIKIDGQYTDEKNTNYLVMKIIDLTATESRQIRVKYSTLEELHNSVQNDNQYIEVLSSNYYNLKLPEFPPKDPNNNYLSRLKGAFMQNNQENKKYDLETALNEYYKRIFKVSLRTESLTKFLREQPDGIRQQDLLKHEKSFNTKADLMKFFTTLEKFRVDSFKKIYHVVRASGEKQYILNRFRLPNSEQFDRLKKQYYENQVRITDFTNICEVSAIFKLRGQGGLSSIWSWGRGEKKDKQEKSSIFLQMGYAVDEKRPHEYLWSVEELWGKSLELDIDDRRLKGNFYKFDELLQIAQTLIQAVHDLHKIDLPHKNIRPANICIQDNIIKLSCIAEPVQEFRESWKNQPKICEFPYQSPETVSNYGNNSGYYSSQFINQYKLDAWATGVTLLQAATLSKISDMQEIHSQNNKWLTKSLQNVHERYGLSSGIASLLTVMTLRNPKDRADLQEQLQQIYQTHLIPMHYIYLENTLNLIQNVKTIRYSLNSLNENTLKKFYFDIQENQRQAPPVYEITIQITESTSEQELSILLDQLKIISIKILRLVFDKFDEYERISNLIEILGASSKDLAQLEIILKENFSLQQGACHIANALNKVQQLKQLKIDLLRCQSNEKDTSTFSLNLIDNQSKIIKIYTPYNVTELNDRMKIINQIN